MLVVRCRLFAACGVIFAVNCDLFGVCCLLWGVWCVIALHVNVSLLFVV